MVALDGEDLEVCIFCILRCVFPGKSSHLVLQIAQLVRDIDESDALAVFGEVSRREEIGGGNAFPCIGDEVFDVRTQNVSALDDELGVTGGGVIEVAVFIAFRRRGIAIFLGEVVDVAHLSEFQTRSLRGADKIAGGGSGQSGTRKREGQDEREDQERGRYSCREPEPVFHNSSLFHERKTSYFNDKRVCA